MKNYPQTFATDVSKNIEAIGKFGCLAMCYLFCIGIDGDCSDYVRSVSNAMNEGLLDSECTVLDAEKFLEHFSGRKFHVTKKNYKDISEIKNPTPVRYSYNGKSHWVVVENGKIVFNSLANSLCVTKGKLDQNSKNPNARVISL